MSTTTFTTTPPQEQEQKTLWYTRYDGSYTTDPITLRPKEGIDGIEFDRNTPVQQELQSKVQAIYAITLKKNAVQDEIRSFFKKCVKALCQPESTGTGEIEYQSRTYNKTDTYYTLKFTNPEQKDPATLCTTICWNEKEQVVQITLYNDSFRSNKDTCDYKTKFDPELIKEAFDLHNKYAGLLDEEKSIDRKSVTESFK